MSVKAIFDILESVPDPEIPVLSVVDLGIVRDVAVDGKKVKVTITPTYSGCPAMDMMEVNIKAALQDAGYEPSVELILSPAWTTDWLSESGKSKLQAYGIAPPKEQSSDKRIIGGIAVNVPCPRCLSTNTKLLSQFGSTACKALYQCNECLEPFDYFKCH